MTGNIIDELLRSARPSEVQNAKDNALRHVSEWLVENIAEKAHWEAAELKRRHDLPVPETMEAQALHEMKIRGFTGAERLALRGKPVTTMMMWLTAKHPFARELLNHVMETAKKGL